MPNPRAKRAPQPAIRPNPIQNFQLTKADFENPGRLNTMMQQLITSVQALQGSAGRTVLPAGIDVQGATVSGVGAPEKETDAISSGHAAGNYSAPVIGPQLDIGGKHALKGLTGLQIQSNDLQNDVAAIQGQLAVGANATVTLAKLTTGGTNGSMTFVKGILTAYTAPT